MSQLKPLESCAVALTGNLFPSMLRIITFESFDVHRKLEGRVPSSDHMSIAIAADSVYPDVLGGWVTGPSAMP